MIVTIDPNTLTERLVLCIVILFSVLMSFSLTPLTFTEPLFIINPILTLVVYRFHRIPDLSVSEDGHFSFDNQQQDSTKE